MSVLVFEAADFLCRRLLEVFFYDFHGVDLGRLAYMLVHVVENGFLLGLEVVEELVFGFLVPVQDIVIELHECHELAFPFHHERLVHSAEVVDDLLDFLRIDIFAGRTENHIVQPALYVIAAF